MLSGLCVCSLIPSPKLETRTKVILFIHRYEDRKPTNTGRLATECLANSEIFVRGHESLPSPPFVADHASAPLFLFPHPGATPLGDYARSSAPVTLIVPDGSWRQASKVQNRVPGLRDVPCVFLPPEERSTYRLRHEAHEGGLATIEAIARAMNVLEGADVRAALLRVFDAMVERTLWSRGQLETEDLRFGLPKGLLRHDPRVSPPATE